MITMAASNHQTKLEALEKLCTTYHPSILAYLLCKGNKQQNAEDLAQQFFYQIVNKDVIRHVERSKGKFRTFLLTCLKNFIINRIKYENRLKRGGSKNIISIHHDNIEILERLESEARTPDQEFDLKWANTVVDTAINRLERSWDDASKSFAFSELRTFLVDPRGTTPIPELANRLQVSTAALKSAIHRLRNQYAQCVRDVVADTVQSPDQVEEELQNLLFILSQS